MSTHAIFQRGADVRGGGGGGECPASVKTGVSLLILFL